MTYPRDHCQDSLKWENSSKTKSLKYLSAFKVGYFEYHQFTQIECTLCPLALLSDSKYEGLSSLALILLIPRIALISKEGKYYYYYYKTHCYARYSPLI